MIKALFGLMKTSQLFGAQRTLAVFYEEDNNILEMLCQDQVCITCIISLLQYMQL